MSEDGDAPPVSIEEPASESSPAHVATEEDDEELVRVPDEGGRPEEEADGMQIDLPTSPSGGGDEDDDERAPRMVWDADPDNEANQADGAEAPRQTESMARRAMRKIGKRLTGKPSTRKPNSSPQEGGADRGSSLSRFFGIGGNGSPNSEGGPERRGSSLARIFGEDGTDLRGSSVGRLVFSESKDGKLKAFRNIRKLTSRARKTITGLSSSEAADALEEARRFQKALERQESGLDDDDEEGNQSHLAPEDRLMAAVGARRREWQMVYSHLYMKGLGMGGLVDKLLKCGITLADYHSLAVEDEDLDSQAMGFEDFDAMVEQDNLFAEMEKELGEDEEEGEKTKTTASLENMAASSKKKSTLDEDLSIDTGCSMEEARRLRLAVLAFYKCEKALGYLKGHGFDGVLERILKLGFLPDDVREDCFEDDPSLLDTLRNKCGLSDSVIEALGKALLQYDKVQAALNEFDSLSMSEEASFQMNLGLPMGLRLDDDTLVVLSVEPGSQADDAGVPVGCRVLAVGGETVTIVEDAIAAIKRMRDAGNFEATVVYKEFTMKEDAPLPAASEEVRADEPSEAAPEGVEDTGVEEKVVAAKDPLVAADPTKEEGDEPVDLPGIVDLPGMNIVEGGEEGSEAAAQALEEEVIISPKRKDRRASWDMTQHILQDKRSQASANLMPKEEFDELVARVRDEEENEMRVSMVAESVGDGDDDEDINSSHSVLKANVGLKLLNSAQIIELCECTPSVKTKHAFLEVLIPRCTDPSEGGAAIVNMFRFTDDRERASDALKIRASALKAGMQMVASTGGAFTGGSSAGASAAAVAIAGVTYSASTNVNHHKRRGSLGGGIGGSTSKTALSRDAAGMIANPLLRKPTSHSRGI